MSTKRSGWRSVVALVAAYALALQTLFLAASLGAQAAQATGVDLHVLCSASSDAPDTPNHDKAGHQADCCVLSGNVLAKILAPPPAAIHVERHATVVSLVAVIATTPALARPHSPLTARGPPRA